jgi:biotin carboxyl carrier protein
MREEITRYHVFIEGRQYEVAVDEQTGAVTVDDEPFDIDLAPIEELEYSALVGRRSTIVSVEPAAEAGSFRVGDGSRTYDVRVRDDRKDARDTSGGLGDQDGGDQLVRASMPGIVTQILVAIGEAVEDDQSLLILEAMKMENEIRSSMPGRVAEIRATVGQSVSKGDVLAVIEPAEEDGDAEG